VPCTTPTRTSRAGPPATHTRKRHTSKLIQYSTETHGGCEEAWLTCWVWDGHLSRPHSIQRPTKR
jgi:hypothetical protein